MWSEPLKEYRERVVISQQGMAHRMGLSLRQYQDIENGAAPRREIHTYAHDIASMHMALDARYDTSVLTPTAVQLVAILSRRLTHADLVRGGMISGARARLNQDEYDALVVYERQFPRPLHEDEVDQWAEGRRLLAADKSGGQVKVPM